MHDRHAPMNPAEAARPPVDVYVPGCAGDPRDDTPIPGVEIHRGPPLHPDESPPSTASR